MVFVGSCVSLEVPGSKGVSVINQDRPLYPDADVKMIDIIRARHALVPSHCYNFDALLGEGKKATTGILPFFRLNLLVIQLELREPIVDNGNRRGCGVGSCLEPPSLVPRRLEGHLSSANQGNSGNQL